LHAGRRWRSGADVHARPRCRRANPGQRALHADRPGASRQHRPGRAPCSAADDRCPLALRRGDRTRHRCRVAVATRHAHGWGRAMSLVQFPSMPGRSASDVRATLPRAPQTIEETGLSSTFLVELIAKTMFQLGLTRLTELSAQLCLGSAVVEAVCQFMRRETLLEVTRRGQHEADVQFDLTQAGRARAADWLMRSSYVGAAPVPLDVYAERVAEQSLANQPITLPQVH